LVSTFNDAGTDTQGFIARDDTRKEIVVALRGRWTTFYCLGMTLIKGELESISRSTSTQDFVTDAEIVLTPFVSPGVNAPGTHHMHAWGK
jgi:hypothetical protein